MANSQVGIDISLAAVARGLNSPIVFKWLSSYHQQKYNYLKVTEYLRNRLGAPSLPNATANLKINSMVMDAVNLNAPITGIIKVGNNLVIDIGTNQGELFRLNQIIYNKNGQKSGICIAHAPNQVTLAPVDINGTADTLSVTDWAVGTFIAEGNQLVADRASGKQKGRQIVPRLIEDNLRLFRTNRDLARIDFPKTFIDQALSRGETAESALAMLQIMDLSDDMQFQMESAFIFDKMGTQIINNETSNTQMGYLESVEKRGGIPINSTVPITWSRFLNIAGDTFDNYNADYNEIIVMCGSKFRTNIVLGAEGQGYKTTAGTNSVLAGSGLNFDSVDTPLGKLTFVNFGLFNDKNLFKSESTVGGRFLQESAIFFTATSMKDQLGNIVPVMQDYYGSYGQNSAGIKMTYTPGIIDKNGKFVEEAFSQLDAVELGQVSHTAKVIPNAQPCGYFMLQ